MANKKIDKIPSFHKAAVALLNSQGWKVIVIGNVTVTSRPPLKYNYSLTVDFTGTKKDSPTPKEAK